MIGATGAKHRRPTKRIGIGGVVLLGTSIAKAAPFWGISVSETVNLTLKIG
ncbi:hypothetical protein GCM10009090_38220 [[Pseudomonas] boreopolis]|uniref:Uncharacterized protein n=1 Tax=Xanthomonas boreopolis TaxID=86183 RepID=A0A919FD15_9XANT|nr:hypothetical protein GCM10009090_38220 [[Pseudomonas] boreopolis]